MTRQMVAFAFLLALIGCGPSEPSPSQKAPEQPQSDQESYLPIVLGTKWVYASSNGEELTLIVSKVEDNHGAKVVTVEEQAKDGRTTYNRTMKESVDGLSLVEDKFTEREVPLCQLKLPVKEGVSWESETNVRRKREGITVQEAWKFTVMGTEAVKVPAGTFKATRVVAEFKQTPGSGYTSWYAPGVGMVKREYQQIGAEPHAPKQATVLASFTLGAK